MKIYKINNEEVTQQQFEEYIQKVDALKYVETDTVNAFPFSNFFDGEYKSNRQINDHLQDLVGTNSTRHKSRNGETHKEEEKQLVDNLTNREPIERNPLKPIRAHFYYKGEDFKLETFKTLEDAMDYFFNSKYTNAFYYDYEDNLIFSQNEFDKKEGKSLLENILEDSKSETDFREKIFDNLRNGNFKKQALSDLKDAIKRTKLLPVDVENHKEEAESIMKKILYEMTKASNNLRVKNFGVVNKTEEKQGLKNNKYKANLDVVINRQFPKALQLIALATEYGHQEYIENDSDFLNYKSVPGGSQSYFNAAARHNTERGQIDESGLPHVIHVAWNYLAALELWAEENNINIKEFSEKYLQSLK